MLLLLLLVLSLCCLLVAGEYQLFLLNNSIYPMAVCLDGSPAGYYVELAEDGNNDFLQFYFEGGGWCYEEQDCWERAQGSLGSSKSWTPTSPSLGGLVAPTCNTNPTFCQFNRVWLLYCDGNSFTGYREDPILVNNQQIYFRGQYIVEAVLADLAVNPYTQAFWTQAQEVMVTGCSAGGLATILHGDYVLAHLATNPTTVGLAPISGFFLDAPNLNGQSVYYDQILGSFNLSQNVLGGGLPAACLATNPTQPWLCNFAQFAYPTLANPTFLLNSMMDLWQLECILTAIPVVPATTTHNGHCGALWSQPCGSWSTAELGNCSASEISQANSYAALFQKTLNPRATWNGGFFPSCLTHCEAQSSSCFYQFPINDVTMSSAITQWWQALRDKDQARASQQWTFDCDTLSPNGPQNCNPACPLYC